MQTEKLDHEGQILNDKDLYSNASQGKGIKGDPSTSNV